MTHIQRVRSLFSGLPGGAGVATHYFLDTTTAVASLHTFWASIATLFPTGLTIVVDPTGDTIEDTNGDLVGSWSADPVAAVAGGGSTNYASPVGGMAKWSTATIVDGHRLRGRTYLVPLSREYFGAGGDLDDIPTGSIADAAAELVIEQAESMVIWHRPREAVAADGSRPAITARDGGHGLVTSGTASTFPAVLRSRRD